MSSRTVSESRTTMTEVVLPNDANVHGTILGGKVMHLMDMAGAAAALRHSRKPVVTVWVDSVHFLHPIGIGDLVIVEAVVTRAFHTSIEVQVDVFSEESLTGRQRKTSAAFLTFVAVDEQGRPSPVPALQPQSDQEKERFEQALIRRKRRLKEAGRASPN